MLNILSRSKLNHYNLSSFNNGRTVVRNISIYYMFTWCMLKYNNKDIKLYSVALMSIYTTNSSASYSLQRKQYLWSPNLCFVSLKMHEIFFHMLRIHLKGNPHLEDIKINNAYFINFYSNFL